VKKYVAAPHAVAVITITNKTMNFERVTALVSALAILRLESLLTPPVWLVSVPEDREADSDERDPFSFPNSSLSLMILYLSLRFSEMAGKTIRTETKIVTTVLYA
jgi:hypothetical protein